MQRLAAAGIDASTIRCRSKSLLVIKALVASGRAAGILPTFVCADLVEDAEVRSTRLPITREVWLFVQPHLNDELLTRAVIGRVKKCVANIDG
ncbi:MAG: hypothetical protein ROR55_10850 [Devosia sp.]